LREKKRVKKRALAPKAKVKDGSTVAVAQTRAERALKDDRKVQISVTMDDQPRISN
jgi:hypothetical protein